MRRTLSINSRLILPVSSFHSVDIGVRNFGRGWRKFELRNLPEGLDFEEFGALHDGIALQNLDQFFHVSYEQDDRCFVSQAWNRLFRIKEQLGWEKRSRQSGKEKVTLDDLFLLHSMDGGVSVDVPWHVAKFLCDKAKGSREELALLRGSIDSRR
ncbi:hypothetical protein Tco_0193952 [Tanacetum coccineum]